MNDEIPIIVATIAFGMGINKKNVRFVIHTSFPQSIDAYWQECGRAGRDSKDSHWLLFYSYADRSIIDYFILMAQSDSSQKKREEIKAKREKENFYNLYLMLDYLEERVVCRRKLQLSHFGENFNRKECHNKWDNCTQNKKEVNVDVTEAVAEILKFINEVGDRKFTILQIVKELRKKNKTTFAIKKHGVRSTKSFRDFHENEIK